MGATSGLLGNTVMICGGSIAENIYGYNFGNSADECYSITSQKATLVTHMSFDRFDAASIVLNDNTLWVTGGIGKYGPFASITFASTEHVKMSGSMPGPDLPMALNSHAMAAINSSVSMIIGGYDGSGLDGTSSTFYYNHIEGEWSDGPSLMQSRYYHAAGIITDELTNENFVSVTGGFISQTGWHDSKVFLDSSEILQDGKWIEGKVNSIMSHNLSFENFCS
jgi:hypothetical protein